MSLPLATRAASSATLLSEVISLTRLRPHIMTKNKHIRLRESMDCESAMSDNEVTLAEEEESLSVDSTATLTQLDTSSALRKSNEIEEVTSSSSLPTSPHSSEQPLLRRSSTMTSDKDRSTEKEKQDTKEDPIRRLSNVSNITLTNGCYSPAASMISRATIRSTNAKEKKEKKNREKLLAGPGGSEFSIANQDMDMDYYDYNVVNAGAAPGSYLGMDPAFLVWIPPLDETGEILPEDERECHEMEDIRPHVYIDPGSNKESPEEEMLLPKLRTRSVSESTSKCSPILNSKNRRVHPLLTRENEIDNKFIHEVEPLVNAKAVAIQMHEFPKRLRTSPKCPKKDMEKETKVEKSPSLEGEYLDDIKFADDEEEEDLPGNQCNIGLSYQDSNIISSS
ncbi:hypothetical protein JTB14_029712 [Gonioctena quinquepunctata]|nr:hypothetical protein JTB14_029712 [Gonioctena quinquepunctata]